MKNPFSPLARGEFEVWVDLQDPPYLLLVIRREASPPAFEVLDPQENRRVCFSSPDYKEVVFWLGEDEYQRVAGRLDEHGELVGESHDQAI